MAFTFNGVGTSFCYARGLGETGDAIECFVFLLSSDLTDESVAPARSDGQ